MSLLFLASSAKEVGEIISNVTRKGKKMSVDRVLHTSECIKDHSSSKNARVKQHLSRNSSAVHEHCLLTGHSVDSSKTKVLATKSNTFKRHIREEIEFDCASPLN